MKIVVIGSTDLTKTCIQTLVDIGRAPTVVVTAEERFKISYAQNENREVRNYRFASIPSLCDDHNIHCMSFRNNTTLLKDLDNYSPSFDLALVVGWYHMIPKNIRDLFMHGCAGIHASKLPALRGGAPLNWAILLGLKETAVSLFELTDGVDDGLIWDQEPIAIDPRETIATLVLKSHEASATMLRRTLPILAEGHLEKTPQKGTPTYGLQRTPQDGEIDWSRSATDIDRLVRAVTRPYPGAYSYLNGEPIYIWECRPVADGPAIYGANGQIFIGPEKDINIVTGDGPIFVEAATDSAGRCALNTLRSSNHQRFSKAPHPTLV